MCYALLAHLPSAVQNKRRYGLEAAPLVAIVGAPFSLVLLHENLVMPLTSASCRLHECRQVASRESPHWL